jgi:RNA polymerase sigma-70 factor (ECF subfamily)
VIALTESSPEYASEPEAGGEEYDSVDLGQLVSACLAGDRDAMQQIYEQCSSHVYALMVRIVGRQDADDLTQQVFLQMFRKLNQFSGGSKLETWLYRLATNEALQHLRRNKRQAVQPLVAEPSASDPNRLMESEKIQMLEVALSRIDPELRAILSLKEEQNLSYREIADSIGIPEGTVGSRLNRARKELRDQLTKLDGGEEG